VGLYYIAAGTLRDRFIELDDALVAEGVTAGWAANAENRPPYWDPRSEAPMRDYDRTTDTTLGDFEAALYGDGTGTAPEAPVLTELSPNSAPLYGEDVRMNVIGTGFTPSSVILWDNKDEPTTIESDTNCSTIVKPSIHGEPLDFNVEVRNGSAKSNTLVFSITAPVADPSDRSDRGSRFQQSGGV
jgi:hypothetical protein